MSVNKFSIFFLAFLLSTLTVNSFYSSLNKKASLTGMTKIEKDDMDLSAFNMENDIILNIHVKDSSEPESYVFHLNPNKNCAEDEANYIKKSGLRSKAVKNQ